MDIDIQPYRNACRARCARTTATISGASARKASQEILKPGKASAYMTPASAAITNPISKRGEEYTGTDRDRFYGMRKHKLTTPKLMFIVATRAAIGAGAALLLSSRLKNRQRKILGGSLIAL